MHARVSLAGGLTFSVANTSVMVNPPNPVDLLLFPDPLSVTTH